MITPFSKGIKRESENYLNKLFNFNDYFQLFFAHSNCYSFLNRCSQVCLCARILDKSYRWKYVNILILYMINAFRYFIYQN